MDNPWTPKHEAGIDKLYAQLLSALKPAVDDDDAKSILKGLGWAYGHQVTPESPSQRVKRTLANLAMVEVTRDLMLKSGAVG